MSKYSKPKQQPTQSVGAQPSKQRYGGDLKKLQRVFAGAFLLLVLLRFVASFFPKERLWGINYFAYLPMWANVGLTLIGVVCCVPGWGERLAQRISERKERKKQTERKGSARRQELYALTGAMVFAILCYLFRVPFSFLGDGAYVLTQIPRWFGLYGIHDPISFSRFIGSEPLTVLINAYTAKWLDTVFGLRTVYAFWILGPIAGGGFVFLLWKFMKTLASDKLVRVVAFVSILSCAGTLLFFGYIENYAYITVGILGYCYVGIRCLRQKSSIWTAAGVLVLCICLHYMAVCLIPSWLLLVWHHYLGERRPLHLKPLLIIIGVSTVVLVGLYLLFFLVVWPDYSSGGGKFIALVERSGIAYTLFSHYHIVDIGNELLLSAPIGMLLLVIGLGWYRKEIIWDKPEMLFLLVVGVYLFLMMVSLNSLLGMARDWDIFSVVGLAITLWAVHLWKGVWSERCHRFGVVTIVGVGMTGLIGWIAVNSSLEMGSARYIDLLGLYEPCIGKGFVAYGYENLRKFYHQNEQEDEEFETIQKMIDVTNGDPGERDKLLLFVASTNPAKYRESFLNSLDSLSHAVERSMQISTAKKDTLAVSDKQRFLFDVYARYLITASVLYNLDIQKEGEKFKTTFPVLPHGYELLGWHYFLKRDYAAAFEHFRQSYAMDTLRINTLIGLGKTFYNLTRDAQTQGAQYQEVNTYASEALYFFEKALAIQPKPWIVIDGEVGYLYLWFGEYSNARKYFERYLQVDNTSPNAQGIKQELSKLQGGAW